MKSWVVPPQSTDDKHGSGLHSASTLLNIGGRDELIDSDIFYKALHRSRQSFLGHPLSINLSHTSRVQL